ncbi:hypothetical protein BKA70DRAFT_1450797 [Coprinopsis sp. MPI-PUGE-AT-0042]|nr:hypothetical protein BKA70DRAFT_1450797 [Coprinopsis sp. MPI-PUGE-AT-0042]
MGPPDLPRLDRSPYQSAWRRDETSVNKMASASRGTNLGTAAEDLKPPDFMPAMFSSHLLTRDAQVHWTMDAVATEEGEEEAKLENEIERMHNRAVYGSGGNDTSRRAEAGSFVVLQIPIEFYALCASNATVVFLLLMTFFQFIALPG